MRRHVLIAFTLCSFAGCAGTRSILPPVGNAESTTTITDSAPITKVVCLWEPGAGRVPEGPSRGVLGQLMFFSGSDRSPQEVRGTLTIYMFDNHGSTEQQSKPVLKLVLTPQELAAVHSESILGHAYNIPVPYPKMHRLETTCTMRVKYTSPSGNVAYSDLANVILEGKSRSTNSMTLTRTLEDVARREESAKTRTDSQTRRVGSAEIAEHEAGADRLRSLTIRRNPPGLRTVLGRRNAKENVSSKRAVSADTVKGHPTLPDWDSAPN